MKVRIFTTPLMLAAAMVAVPALVRAEETPDATPPAVVTPAPAQPENNMPETPADVAAAPDDAVKTDSGLASKVLKAGNGDKKPTAADTLTVHYSGWTTDGKMFDSSVKRGEPSSFPLNGVIKGWTEGLQLMVVGEKRRFWIPEDLAYGPAVEGGGRPGGMLCFDVELLEIKDAPKPPEDTEKTAGGVAYKITKEGAGEKPGPDKVISFHFTAKTMDGRTMQDTRTQPAPASATLDKLPPALGEILADMKVGELRTSWLPEAQAPGGFIVADIELVSFKEAPPAPKVPEDVAAAPADAKKTDSGLAYKVLTEARARPSPRPPTP